MANTIRGEVLAEALGLIEGDRNHTYGSPTQNFQNTADIWTALMRHKLKDGEVFTAYEVASLMIALKLARIVAQPKRDNWVDIAGYAGCGYEAVGDDVKPEPEKARSVWRGSNKGSEPPEYVVQLRALASSASSAGSSEFLWRTHHGRWFWACRNEFSAYEWDHLLNDDIMGYTWASITALTDRTFEEVPQ